MDINVLLIYTLHAFGGMVWLATWGGITKSVLSPLADVEVTLGFAGTTIGFSLGVYIALIYILIPILYQDPLPIVETMIAGFFLVIITTLGGAIAGILLGYFWQTAREKVS